MFIIKGEVSIKSSAALLPFGNRYPSLDDRKVARKLLGLLAAQKNGDALLRVTDPEAMGVSEITLTPTISALFREALSHIGNGDAVSVIPIQRTLTTQQAADLLNVSRPYFIKLLEAGDIAFTIVGRHRRINAEDVFAYKEVRDQARSAALRKLMRNDADLY